MWPGLPLAALVLSALLVAPSDAHTIALERGPIAWIAAGEGSFGSRRVDREHAAGLCRREVHRDRTSAMQCFGASPADAEIFVRCAPIVFAYEAPPRRVWLRAFGIDRTEVSRGAYLACVRDGACDAVGGLDATRPREPVADVSWDDARTYCEWAGGALPTEAEWERTARGGDERMFPWGTQYDPRRANHGAFAPDCVDDGDGDEGVSEVGTHPDGATPDGVQDMAGNVAEWVADLWDDEESVRLADGLLVDPRGASHGAEHVVRGGSYASPSFALRTTARDHRRAHGRSPALGFRCAYHEAEDARGGGG